MQIKGAIDFLGVQFIFLFIYFYFILFYLFLWVQKFGLIHTSPSLTDRSTPLGVPRTWLIEDGYGLEVCHPCLTYFDSLLKFN